MPIEDIKPKKKKEVPKTMREVIKEKPKKTEPEKTEKPKKEIIGFSWNAPEYEYLQKQSDWYWSVGILSFGFAIVAYLLNNFLLGVFVILAGFTIMLYGAKRPKTVKFEINYKGLIIDNRLFSFDDLKSFWMHYDPPHKKELGVESKKTFMPRLIIPLQNQDPNEIRTFLLKFLEEEPYEESLIEAITKYLGF